MGGFLHLLFFTTIEGAGMRKNYENIPMSTKKENETTNTSYFSDIELSTDPFYSEANMAYLKKSVIDLRNRKGKIHELIEVDDE